MIIKLVEHIVKHLVEKPDAVSVHEIAGDNGKRVIQVRVAPQDLPVVIGREGHTFRSLRSLITAVDSSKPLDIVVEISH